MLPKLKGTRADNIIQSKIHSVVLQSKCEINSPVDTFHLYLFGGIIHMYVIHTNEEANR